MLPVTSNGVAGFSFIIMSNPIQQEIILQPDGNFYKRTVVTTLLKSQAEAVQRVKSKPVFHVTDIPVSPSTHIAAFTGTDRNYLFREIPFFMFRGALLERIPDSEYYHMFIPRVAFQRTNDNHIQTSEFNNNKGLCWDATALGFRMFIMFPHQYIPNEGKVISAGSPYLFLYSPQTGCSFVPNLPNIYDSGKICTGDNFTNGADSTQELMAVNVHELNTSNCNNDLRMDNDNEARFVRFDRSGNTIEPDGSDLPTDCSGNRFFLQVHQEPILEYTTWLNNTRH